MTKLLFFSKYVVYKTIVLSKSKDGSVVFKYLSVESIMLVILKIYTIYTNRRTRMCICYVEQHDRGLKNKSALLGCWLFPYFFLISLLFLRAGIFLLFVLANSVIHSLFAYFLFYVCMFFVATRYSYFVIQKLKKSMVSW